jgi:hypothetical protein
MGCSVFSEDIKILLDAGQTGITAPAAYGSALQNPDISKVQLAAMLRRRVRPSVSKTRKTFWSSFMDRYVLQHANSND